MSTLVLLVGPLPHRAYTAYHNNAAERVHLSKLCMCILSIGTGGRNGNRSGRRGRSRGPSRNRNSRRPGRSRKPQPAPRPQPKTAAAVTGRWTEAVRRCSA